MRQHFFRMFRVIFLWIKQESMPERRNEWLTARTRPKAEEFDVLPLSDREIERVLDFLTKEKALGEMEHLDREFQFQIVKNRHEQQLLVAMREAMAGEGVGFDVIIENEYQGIEQDHATKSLFAKELYLLVCCFYQHGVLIRDRLLEAVLGRPLHTLHQEVGSALDGLVEYTTINIALGEYAARARHRQGLRSRWRPLVSTAFSLIRRSNAFVKSEFVSLSAPVPLKSGRSFFRMECICSWSAQRLALRLLLRFRARCKASFSKSKASMREFTLA